MRSSTIMQGSREKLLPVQLSVLNGGNGNGKFSIILVGKFVNKFIGHSL